jgi:hypothetical protein
MIMRFYRAALARGLLSKHAIIIDKQVTFFIGKETTMRIVFSIWPRELMTCTRSRWALFLGLAVLASMSTGCGKRNGGRGALYPAEGQVLLDEEPLAGAIVTLYPRGVSDEKAKPSQATTGPDGKFRVGTFSAEDGAPAGEYAVTVIRYPMKKQGDGGYAAGSNDVPKKYASLATTDLHIQLGEGKREIPPLALLSGKIKDKKGPAPKVIASE